ncbi:ATP-binding protein [Sulfurimonas sp.]
MSFKLNKLSLYQKLLLLFLLIGLFPFFLFYIYVIYWAEDKIIVKIIKEQHAQAQRVVDNIDNHLLALYDELFFLSEIDIMDDIIANDIDKRIARVLLQKKKDINLDLDFFVIDMQAHIISSSRLTGTNEKFIYANKLQKAFLNSRHYFFSNNKLYIYNKIFASFASDKELGMLVLEYDLENLKYFFKHEDGVYSTIYNANKKIYIGKKLPFHIDIKKVPHRHIYDKYLVTINKMPDIMQGWYFIYYLDKKEALSFLYDFLYFMLAMIPIVVILVLIIGIYSTRSIIKPIKYLTKTTEEITKTKNYNQSISVNSTDEIGRLSYAFNELLKETNSALNRLEKENKLRLKRFIELIEIFNAIMQTTSELECIDTSISQMQFLTNNHELHFTKFKGISEDVIAINVTNFEDASQEIYGYIVIDVDAIHDSNEMNFYYAIVSMIALQLDRIRLVNKTVSASNAKSSFISNMSHELRTPLNSIISSTQYLISYETMSNEQQDMIANVENSAQYLLEMINGILDIAKIEAGKMDVSYSVINIGEILEEISLMFRPLAEEKNLSLIFNTNAQQVIKIKSDIKLFKQVVINLLSNAIKFTHEGFVEIKVQKLEESVVISIKDSGIGLSQENITQLFEDFTQIRSSAHKEYEGTGLGLSLSRKLANLLGGDVTIKSQGIGFGSEAFFIIKNQA